MSSENSRISVAVNHHQGLHARPCLAIVNTVRQYQAEVTVNDGKQMVNAANILELMMLGVASGQTLVLSAKGPEAQEALSSLARLFAANFGLF